MQHAIVGLRIEVISKSSELYVLLEAKLSDLRFAII